MTLLPRQFLVLLLLIAAGAPARAGASLTVAGLADTQGGRSYDLDAWFAPTDFWSLGAGLGHSESDLSGTRFSGTSLRASTDLLVRSFSIGLGTSRWEDSENLVSATHQLLLGWMADSGFSAGAILEDRTLDVSYRVRGAGGGDRRVEFAGTGVGGDLAYLGRQWSASVHYVSYRYGNSLARVRAVVNAPTTEEFPRLQALVDSIITQAAGAPAHRAGLSLGRELRRTWLRGEWQLQRDALTLTDVHSVIVRQGIRAGRFVEIETTLGYSGGGAYEDTGFGGVALTLRR